MNADSPERSEMITKVCMAFEKTPPELDRIVDQVLAYRPAAKTKAAKRRKRKRQRDAKKC